jgi:integrase
MPKSLPRVPLTDKQLRALRPAPTGKRIEVADGDVRNLLVRVTPGGKIAFALLVRPERGGNPTRRLIGDYGTVTDDGTFAPGRLTLKKARERARQWNSKFATGVDPRIEALAAAEQLRAENAKGIKFKDTVSGYLDRRVRPKIRRAREIERQLEFFTDAWPTKPLAAITADDIEELLERKSETHPAMARNLFATLRAMFNWAGRKKEYRPLANPCDSADTEIFGAKSARDRTLNDDEIRLLVRNVRRMPYPFGHLYRMLLLTGLRLNEVARARWSEFDFENNVWEIPASRMKGKLPHVVPITPDLLSTIETIPRPKGAVFVFSTMAGASPVSGFSKTKARLALRMVRSLTALARQRDVRHPVSIPRWTNHDLRRTFRTQLSAMGNILTHEVKEALLAHTKKGIHGTYDKYQYLDEKRAALPLWAQRLRTILAAEIGDLEKFIPKKLC